MKNNYKTFNSEIKIQKLFLFADFIPQPDGHYLIKLFVIRKSPKYRSTFQYGLAYSDYFIHGEEEQTAVKLSSFCVDIGKSYNINIISFLIGIDTI